MSLNYWILVGTLPITAVLFCFRHYFTAFDFKKSPATAWAATLWALSWLSLVPIYGTEKHSFSWGLIITDIGSSAVLFAALILKRGSPVVRDSDTVVVIPFLLLLVWDYVLGVAADGVNKPLLGVLALTPSLFLAQFSILLLGWAFVLRWGIYGVAFFVLCILDAILQPLAYISLNLIKDFHLAELPEEAQFRYVVDALGLLKIPLAYGFLGFLVSRTRPSFTVDSSWPPESVAPDKRIFIPISSAFAIIGGKALIGVFWDAIKGFFK